MIMDKKNSIYQINTDILSDENIVISDIMKLCQISREKNEDSKYIWVSIKKDYGIGILTPLSEKNDMIDCLLWAINTTTNDETSLSFIGRSTLTAILEKEKEFINILTKKLSNEEDEQRDDSGLGNNAVLKDYFKHINYEITKTNKS